MATSSCCYAASSLSHTLPTKRENPLGSKNNFFGHLSEASYYSLIPLLPNTIIDATHAHYMENVWCFSAVLQVEEGIKRRTSVAFEVGVVYAATSFENRG